MNGQKLGHDGKTAEMDLCSVSPYAVHGDSTVECCLTCHVGDEFAHAAPKEVSTTHPSRRCPRSAAQGGELEPIHPCECVAVATPHSSCIAFQVAVQSFRRFCMPFASYHSCRCRPLASALGAVGFVEAA